MDPLTGAIEAHAELANLFDTHLLSTTPWKNLTPWSGKLQFEAGTSVTGQRRSRICGGGRDLPTSHKIAWDGRRSACLFRINPRALVFGM